MTNIAKRDRPFVAQGCSYSGNSPTPANPRESPSWPKIIIIRRRRKQNPPQKKQQHAKCRWPSKCSSCGYLHSMPWPALLCRRPSSHLAPNAANGHSRENEHKLNPILHIICSQSPKFRQKSICPTSCQAQEGGNKQKLTYQYGDRDFEEARLAISITL